MPTSHQTCHQRSPASKQSTTPSRPKVSQNAAHKPYPAERKPRKGCQPVCRRPKRVNFEGNKPKGEEPKFLPIADVEPIGRDADGDLIYPEATEEELDQYANTSLPAETENQMLATDCPNLLELLPDQSTKVLSLETKQLSRQQLEQILRILKPNGRLCITAP